MNLWITWNVPTHFIGAFVSVVMVLYILLKRIKLRVSFLRVIAASMLLMAYYLGYTLNNLGAVLGPMLTLLPCLLLFFISDPKIPIDVFNFIVNFFAILLPISLFVFLLTFAGIPSIGSITHYSGFYGSFDNYLFAFRSNMYGYRFSSVFLEPGHLGMILAYLLFALKYNFRDFRVVVFLVASFFTFSLAAYVLNFIGYIVKLVLFKELRVKLVIIGGLLLLMSYLFATNYNDGDNIVNERVFERLQPSEEKGFSGNNRTYGLVDDVYEIVMNNKELLLWGIGVDKYNLIRENFRFGGAGIKVYVLRRGLISVLLVFAAYFLMGISLSKNRLYVLGFLFLLALSFWQRAYPFWASWLIPFIGGVIIQGESLKKKFL